MTARTPYQAGGGDVSATLSELERKLRELERELNATARSADAAPPAPPAAEPTPPPAPPAPDADTLIAQARARLGTLDSQVDELLRFREQLQRTARELEEEYSRVLERIGAPATPPAAAPPPQAPPPVPGPVRAPIVPTVDEAALLPNHPAFAQPDQTLPAPAVAPPPAAAPEPPPPPPAPDAAHEDRTFDGAIVVDAGPFTDIAALSAFEQGLARVPGAEDVYVSGFEGNRALIELRLSQPVALVREMRQAVPAGFTVTDAAAGRLRLDVTAITPGG